MRILSISAQKPNSTGSGIYMTELVKAFESMGHEQAVIAGINEGESSGFHSHISFYPVIFKSDALPFPVCGMSDEMPYESTRYRDMTEQMRQQFQTAFMEVAKEAIHDFDPDLIICHHLYLMTATIRDNFPEKRILGICHNTDLRQLEKITFARDYIISKINKLDEILALHQAQKEKIIEIFAVPSEKVRVVGSGYNSNIFNMGNSNFSEPLQAVQEKENNVIHVAYAGKIAIKKGVLSLIKCSSHLKTLLEPNTPEIVFHLAGSAGNTDEFKMIKDAALKAECSFEFTGPLPQPKLAEVYRNCQLFVLPSFYEGLPLTPVEAMACGCRAIITDVPGVKDWIMNNAPDARISFVALPEMRNVDEPVEEALPAFELDLAKEIKKSIDILPNELHKTTDLSGITWSGLASRILGL